MPIPFREKLKNSPGIGPILLFILPIPLLIVIVQSLISGNLATLIASILSLSSIWLAAWCLRKAHLLEWTSKKRKWHRSSRTPWRYIAALLVGFGIFVVTFSILSHNLVIAIIFSIMAFFGVVLRYGVDPQNDSSKDTNLVGVTTEELVEILDEAETNLASIDASAKSIPNKELSRRLNNISTKTREILTIIEEDPKDLRRARKFLKVYLLGAQKVAHQYANTPHAAENDELEQNFRNVLTTIEDVIDEQKSKLLENNILDLDVKIEVLEAQLKHEGVI